MGSDLVHVVQQPAIAVILVFMLIVFGARDGVRSCGLRKAVTAMAPSILLIYAVCSPFPNSHHYAGSATEIAIAICLGFGLALAIENISLLSRPYRINGSVFALIHGSLIAFLAGSFLHIGDGWIAYIGLGGPPIFWLIAIPNLIVLNRKAKRRLLEIQGLCRHCGYNLTGNVSGVCPECGNAITQSIPDGNSSDEAG